MESHASRPPATDVQLKEAFISLISDDLLTPLAAIKASAELIQKVDDLGPRTELIRQGMGRILEATCRLTEIVDDLLDISRIEDGSFPVAARPISLGDFLPDLLAYLALPLEGRRLELSFAQGLPLAWADPVLLERVVRNLLIAAIKHSPDDSPILVQVRQEEAMIRVSVTDHGAGIDAARMRRTLEKLRRPPAGGLGLCLYITKRAVEALGGQVQIQSAPGIGSTFSFTLLSFTGTPDSDPTGAAPSQGETR